MPCVVAGQNASTIVADDEAVEDGEGDRRRGDEFFAAKVAQKESAYACTVSRKVPANLGTEAGL